MLRDYYGFCTYYTLWLFSDGMLAIYIYILYTLYVHIKGESGRKFDAKDCGDDAVESHIISSWTVGKEEGWFIFICVLTSYRAEYKPYINYLLRMWMNESWRQGRTHKMYNLWEGIWRFLEDRLKFKWHSRTYTFLVIFVLNHTKLYIHSLCHRPCPWLGQVKHSLTL